MNKTPVSILQEMMVKKQTIPDYELIHDGGGTHDNTFTYKVSCDGLSAIGSGRSKKDAKHEAAKSMLETIAVHKSYLQLPPPEKKSPSKIPLPAAVPVYPKIPPNVPFMNAIGDLKALCCDKNLQEPEYHQISDVGPPHLRVFTVKCVVANFKEEAAATTKKQAKHEAARKMLERIRNLVVNSDDDNSDQDETIVKQNDKAAKSYITLSKLYSTKKVNLGLKIFHYHSHLRNSHAEELRKKVVESTCSLLQKYKKYDFATACESLLPEIQEILKQLNLHMTQSSLTSENEKIILKVVEFDSIPNLVSIGMGRTDEEALFKAIEKILTRLMDFIK